MRITQLQNQYLYEGLDYSQSRTVALWESAGIKLKEAALTADQIQQIFQSVEQGATAAGGNRTLLGKGKDAAEAVNKAWEDLKTKIQNSGPIKNVDNAYDSAVAKIEAGLGGPDNALNKVIQRYRKFAKEHPVAQGFIYSALIAAAGISSAGLGGAAVLGLLKMADKLLQGEKFSSAAYSGAKTGAMAYGASKLGDLVRGGSGSGVDAAADAATSGLAAVRKQAADEAMKAVQDALANGADPRLQGQLADVAQSVLEKYSTLQGGPLSVQTAEILAQKVAMQALKSASENIIWSGRKLSEGQVYMIFNRVSAEVLTEGPMDAIKGAAGKAAGWLATKGKNLTTKVTADKLNSAWKKAGSPMDSDQLAAFLADQGVDPGIVDKVYADLKLPTADPQGKKEPTLDDPAKEEPAKAAASPYAEVKKLVMSLDKKNKQRLMKYVTKQLGTA